MIKENNILSFWQKIVKLLSAHKNNYTSRRFVKEIDRLVSDLGSFSWEISPANNQVEIAFTLSPNKDIDLLEETKKVVRLAPKLTGWNFYYAKQAKIGWSLSFNLYADNDEYIEISGKEWEYVLYLFPDNKLDIVIKPVSRPLLTIDEYYTAAEILVIGILGEEFFINHINEIEIISDFEPDIQGKQSLMIHLADHMRKLIK